MDAFFNLKFKMLVLACSVSSYVIPINKEFALVRLSFVFNQIISALG